MNLNKERQDSLVCSSCFSDNICDDFGLFYQIYFNGEWKPACSDCAPWIKEMLDELE